MHSSNFLVGEWRADTSTNTITRDDHEVSLPPRLMDMLKFFAEHPKEVVSREELVTALWNRTAVTDQAVTQSIFELRKSLRDGRKAGEAPEYIQTVPKRGYRLIVAVEWLAATVEAVVSTAPAADNTVHSDTTTATQEQPSSGNKLVNLVKNLWLDPESLGFKKTPY